jgi:hypothetical protein
MKKILMLMLLLGSFVGFSCAQDSQEYYFLHGVATGDNVTMDFDSNSDAWSGVSFDPKSRT